MKEASSEAGASHGHPSPPAGTPWRVLTADEELAHAKLCITCATDQGDPDITNAALKAREACNTSGTRFFVRDLPFFEHHQLIEMQANVTGDKAPGPRFVCARPDAFHKTGILGRMITGDRRVLHDIPPILTLLDDENVAIEYVRFRFDHISTNEGPIHLIYGSEDFLPTHWSRSDDEHVSIEALTAQYVFPCENDKLDIPSARQNFFTTHKLGDALKPAALHEQDNRETGRRLSSTVIFKSLLLHATFRIEHNGSIMPVGRETCLLPDPLPIEPLRTWNARA